MKPSQRLSHGDERTITPQLSGIDTAKLRSSVVTTRLPALDGLRGIAVASVVLFHFTRPLQFPDRLHSLFAMGWTGVDLFFVLSGFLIGGILVDNKDSVNLWRVFYLRRAFRILPLYYFVLITFLIFGGTQLRNLTWLMESPLPTWSYATFTQNFVTAATNNLGPNYMVATWSLAVEEQFYLFLPLVIRFVSARMLPWILAALILLAPITRVVLYHWFSKDHLFGAYVLMPCRMDSLLLGTSAALIFRSDAAMTVLRNNKTILLTALLALLICDHTGREDQF